MHSNKHMEAHSDCDMVMKYPIWYTEKGMTGGIEIDNA